MGNIINQDYGEYAFSPFLQWFLCISQKNACLYEGPIKELIINKTDKLSISHSSLTFSYVVLLGREQTQIHTLFQI